MCMSCCVHVMFMHAICAGCCCELTLTDPHLHSPDARRQTPPLAAGDSPSCATPSCSLRRLAEEARGRPPSRPPAAHTYSLTSSLASPPNKRQVASPNKIDPKTDGDALPVGIQIRSTRPMHLAPSASPVVNRKQKPENRIPVSCENRTRRASGLCKILQIPNRLGRVCLCPSPTAPALPSLG